MSNCWCVCSYYYVESGSFSVEMVYYGDTAKKLAITHALNMNIHSVKFGDHCCPDNYIECNCISEEDIFEEDYLLLTDILKSEEERLQNYISSLDYSGGNYRYRDCIFFDVECVEITQC